MRALTVERLGKLLRMLEAQYCTEVELKAYLIILIQELIASELDYN